MTDIQSQNLVTWLEYQALDLGGGTANQRQRLAHMVLPEDELCKLARTVLFAPFEYMRRWQKLRPSALDHDDTCLVLVPGGPAEKSVDFETAAPTEVTHEQWEIAQALRELARLAGNHPWCGRQKVTFSTDLRSHWMSCKVCTAEIVKPSMLITVPWAGRTLSREYAL